MVGAEIARLAIEDVARVLRERRLSPVEVTEAALARIASLARLNAFITVTAELAREQAREAEREIAAGRYRDRKSTRLNSSHVRISYAVFCLKKKKKSYQRKATSVVTTRPL